MERRKRLERLFGHHILWQKTVLLTQDINSDNMVSVLGNHEAWWVALGLSAGDQIEGKLYLPSDDDGKALDITIIIPGYKGDFVLQEALYASLLVKEGMALLVLRHNHLRAYGDDVVSYVHCPERAAMMDYRYLGDSKTDFDFVKASHELIIALQVLDLDSVGNIHVIGHSWGARIALLALSELTRKDLPATKLIISKLKSLVVLGPWWEMREWQLRNRRMIGLIQEAKTHDFFKEMDISSFVIGMLQTALQLHQIKPGDLSPGLSLSVIYSRQDEHLGSTGFSDEILPVLSLLSRHQRMSVFCCDDMDSGIIGGRPVEARDYYSYKVRNLVYELIMERNVEGVI